MPLDSSNTAEWFKQTRVLFQDASQHALTLAENVLLGQGTETDAIRALDEAGFATRDEIDTDSLNQVLSKEFGGTELSGGQWKKVALARALAKKGCFLMLDEPSAALDPRAEYELFMKLKQLRLGMTTLFIFHRLVATVNADWILVLHNGEVIEQEKHSELMKAEGLYADLFNLQSNLEDVA